MLRQSLARRGVGDFVIGRIVAPSDKEILVSRDTPETIVRSSAFTRSPEGGTPTPKIKSMKPSTSDSSTHHDGCCADIFNGPTAPSSVSETQRAFGTMMRATQASGALNEKAKELILFSLVVSSRCEPCFDAHFRRARELGITQAELDEAAWCAIAMGGAPVKIFYQECKDKYCNSSAAVL